MYPLPSLYLLSSSKNKLLSMTLPALSNGAAVYVLYGLLSMVIIPSAPLPAKQLLIVFVGRSKSRLPAALTPIAKLPRAAGRQAHQWLCGLLRNQAKPPLTDMGKSPEIRSVPNTLQVRDLTRRLLTYDRTCFPDRPGQARVQFCHCSAR